MNDCHAHISNETGNISVRPFLSSSSLSTTTTSVTHLMSTNDDFLAVHAAAYIDPHIVPYYGIHPWFAHLFYVDPPVSKEQFYSSILSPIPSPDIMACLPDPILLTDRLMLIDNVALERTAADLPFGIGEIGLDRAFTIPNTKSHVSLDHQLCILSAFVGRAIQYQCPIQLHGVKAHRSLYDALAGCTVPIVLHLFSGLSDLAKEWMKRHCDIFFSMLAAVNLRSPTKTAALLSVVPPEILVVETDRVLSSMTIATQQEALVQIAECIRNAKSWDDHQVSQVLHENSMRLLRKCTVVTS